MTPASRRIEFGPLLGAGGFGQVYLATVTQPGGITLQVAIKMLHRELGPDHQAAARLQDEAHILQMLQHPSIPKVHDLVHIDGRLCLLSEYIHGEDLSCFLQEHSRLPCQALVEVVADIADALTEAWHAPHPTRGGPLQMVHRDIKPSNIRLERHGKAYLLDFGIARSSNLTREARTKTAHVVGSPGYLPPEAYLGRQIESPADVYALGAVLFAGLTGEHLFPRTTLAHRATLATDEERYNRWLRERLLELPPDTHEGLRALIARALRWDPARRPVVSTLRDDLTRLGPSLPGDCLRTWARARTWPATPSDDGPLSRLSADETDRQSTFVFESAMTTAPPTGDPAEPGRPRAPVWVLPRLAIALAAGSIAMFGVALWSRSHRPDEVALSSPQQAVAMQVLPAEQVEVPPNASPAAAVLDQAGAPAKAPARGPDPSVVPSPAPTPPRRSTGPTLPKGPDATTGRSVPASPGSTPVASTEAVQANEREPLPEEPGLAAPDMPVTSDGPGSPGAMAAPPATGTRIELVGLPAGRRAWARAHKGGAIHPLPGLLPPGTYDFLFGEGPGDGASTNWAPRRQVPASGCWRIECGAWACDMNKREICAP